MRKMMMMPPVCPFAIAVVEVLEFACQLSDLVVFLALQLCVVCA